MIIDCPNCSKKFNVEENLIPANGRNIVCGSCNHKWFYNKKEISISTHPIKNESFLQQSKFSNDENKKKYDFEINKENITVKKIKEGNNKIEINKPSIFSKFFSYLIVFIITLIALIILLDTLKTPLVTIFPSLELQILNLYELMKDIKLFISDLI